MNLKQAAQQCRATGLQGWDLVAYAQKLVNRTMRYSVENSLDMPEQAFENGQGYCWHQASALNIILRELGMDSRLVHAFRNRFPETVLMGVVVHNFVSGHVWCRVRIRGEERDVCPGHRDNVPGKVHFIPLGKVREWNKIIGFFTYYGAALFNRHRRIKYRKIAEKRKAD